MATLVVSGATLKCSFGAASAPLGVLPLNKVMAGAPAANTVDSLPMMNVPPFGMCRSLSNPMVAAATAAALGALTPQPCMPITVGPWSPGCSKVRIGNMPALNDSSKCNCAWGGVIEVANPGQTVVNVD
ncbi:hypothetical protein A176_002412 [Myxococcus hansupus]|uniref:DUF4280 domain-containing protein n=1 Tax=Pseudomyxococcus hansupus TaxID=1297742 RepID=A0A0H4WW00_9BACT|nr:DUF4280 domain-containing protein [Myxococcus hansupus]AKQ65500.1 hypothetical protein A176_002412 [Myxococcus hansupus]